MDILTTTQLMGIYRHIPSFSTFFLDHFFPNAINSNTKEIAFDKLVEDLDLAPFVSPMVAGKVQRTKGGVLKTFEPAYVKPKDVVTPDRLLKRMAGEALGGSLSPQQRRLAIITDILANQDKKIIRREEWMAVQAVLHGKIQVEMDGQGTYEVDYGRNPDNNITLTGAARWTELDLDTSTQPLDDLENWADQSTKVIDTVIMDTQTWARFRKFKSVKELLETRRGSSSQAEIGPIVFEDVKRVASIGNLDIMVYKGKYTKQGVEIPFLPDYTVIMASMGYQGIRAYGAIQDAKANSNGIVATSRYAKNWITEDPSVEYLMTQSAPLMVTPDPDAFVVVKVG